MERKFDKLESETSDRDLDIKGLKFEAYLRRSTPYGAFEYVDVTFNDVGDVDTDIPTKLRPDDPEAIDWEVVQWRFTAAPGGGAVVYKDTGPDRRPWGRGYIILRCNIDSAEATLRLSTRRL